MIMALEEAKNLLRVDYDDDDPRITGLIEAIPAYLETKTGKSWDEEPVNQVAKTTAEFILKWWFDSEYKDLKDTIDSLLITLASMARSTS